MSRIAGAQTGAGWADIFLETMPQLLELSRLRLYSSGAEINFKTKNTLHYSIVSVEISTTTEKYFLRFFFNSNVD